MDVVPVVVIVDVVAGVVGVMGDAVQLALPVLQSLRTWNGSISRVKRKHSRVVVR